MIPGARSYCCSAFFNEELKDEGEWSCLGLQAKSAAKWGFWFWIIWPSNNDQSYRHLWSPRFINIRGVVSLSYNQAWMTEAFSHNALWQQLSNALLTNCQYWQFCSRIPRSFLQMDFYFLFCRPALNTTLFCMPTLRKSGGSWKTSGREAASLWPLDCSFWQQLMA